MSAFYHTLISTLDKFVPPRFQLLWSHPAGPKTIFFWAPLMKWSLVIAGIGDFTRPIEKVSMGQSCALAATGLIWSRYSLIIVPRNPSLFAVNFCVGLSGFYQIGRLTFYNMGLIGDSSKPAEETDASADKAVPKEAAISDENPEKTD